MADRTDIMRKYRRRAREERGLVAVRVYVPAGKEKEIKDLAALLRAAEKSSRRS